MTSEDTTTPALVSRRTVLRTGANAAWMVPAISIATAVPASAACSTATTASFGLVSGAAGPAVHNQLLAKRYFDQTFTVTANGIPGTAAITISLLTGPTLLGLPHESNFAIDVPGWKKGSGRNGLQSGTFARAGSTYRFTKAFNACGEVSAPVVRVTWDALATGPKPVIQAAVSP